MTDLTDEAKIWKHAKDRVIGGTYAACHLNTAPVNDAISFMTSIANNCGIIVKEYPIKNQLVHAAFIGSSNRYNLIVASEETAVLAEIVNKIIYNKLAWPSAAFKTDIIDIIFSVLSPDMKTELDIYMRPLADPTADKPTESPSEIIAGLYGLVKFLVIKDDIPKDISVNITDIINEKFVNKELTNVLIGITVGYSGIFKHQPYFQHREKVDLCLKLYIKYLSGEFNRISIGSMIFVLGDTQYPVVRYMHSPNMPGLGGWWGENFLPQELSQLAKLKRVSYIEDENGDRYRTALEFAQHLYGTALKDTANINAADLSIINAGATAKFAPVVENSFY
jgi:hypothetical protein